MKAQIADVRGLKPHVAAMFTILLVGFFALAGAEDKAKELNETLRTFPYELHEAVYGYPTAQDFPLYVLDGAFFSGNIEPPLTGFEAGNSNESYVDLTITRIVDTGVDFDAIINEGDFEDDEKSFILERGFRATAVWGILGNVVSMEFAGIILSFFSIAEGNKTVSMLIPQLPVSYYKEDVALDFSTCEEFAAGCDGKFAIGSADHTECLSTTFADCQKETTASLSNVDTAAVDGRFGAGTTDELVTMFGNGTSIQNFLADKAAAIIIAQLTRGCVQCAIDNERSIAAQSSGRRQLCSFSCFPWTSCGRTVIVVKVVVVVIQIAVTVKKEVNDDICLRLADVTLSDGQPFVVGNIKKDPHVTTFDGLKYECQARGHFTLVKSLDSPFEVQTRMRKARTPANKQPGFDDDKGNSVINGVALMVGDEPVIQISEAVEPDEMLEAFRINTCPMAFYVDGEMRTLFDGINKLSDQVTVDASATQIGVNVPSRGVWLEIKVELSEDFGCLLDVNVVLSDSFMDSDRFIGLLGSPDGDKTNDWTDPEGGVLKVPKQNGLGHVIDEDKSRDYCETSWCVQKEADSLFTYPAGGTLTFDDLNRCSTVAKSMLRSSNN